MLLIVIAVTYLLVWVLVYSLVMALDYSYIASYFVLAWRGGGELPAVIQMLTFLMMAILLLVVFGIRWRHTRTGNDSRKGL